MATYEPDEIPVMNVGDVEDLDERTALSLDELDLDDMTEDELAEVLATELSDEELDEIGNDGEMLLLAVRMKRELASYEGHQILNGQGAYICCVNEMGRKLWVGGWPDLLTAIEDDAFLFPALNEAAQFIADYTEMFELFDDIRIEANRVLEYEE